jgi:hypothetical protein
VGPSIALRTDRPVFVVGETKFIVIFAIDPRRDKDSFNPERGFPLPLFSARNPR